MNKIAYLLILVFLVFGCKDNKPKPKTAVTPKARVQIPMVSADSAYAYIAKQVSFGPRVPGTPEHEKCKDWLVAKMESLGAQVIVQDFKMDFLDVKKQQCYNIMSQINPEKKNRVLLAAHWDTRKIADKDKDKSKYDQAILGADDGASGVAALIEIARQISLHPIDLGVDIMFFDVEDQGDPDTGGGWCLGSEHWGHNIAPKKYNANFGILLDMVAAKNATFYKEGFSTTFAKPIQDKIWKLGAQMGSGDLFINKNIGNLIDDHKNVNFMTGIKMIDIINYNLVENRFGKYHHTHDDNMDIIDKSVLRKATQLVTAVLYKESDGSF